jgi:ABC-2 type transport system ATP-binding protein
MNASPAAAGVVAVRHVTVRYGRALALDGATLDVAPGSVYALLGRNGAGKSSLVRCLLGQQKPESGTCFLFGEPSWDARPALMRRLGVVPEEPDAPPDMTANDLSRFFGRLYPSWDAPSVSKRLSRFRVPETTPFRSLSKGQKGMVQLSLALASHPDLLVLDDPTLGFDPVARRALFEELVGELADRGTTVFLTTHDLAGVEGIATHVGVLRDGRLVLDGDLETLKARYRRIRYSNERTEDRSEFGTELDGFDAVRVQVRGWGIEALVSNFEEELFERFRETDGVVDAEASALSLEEIFVAVAGGEK